MRPLGVVISSACVTFALIGAHAPQTLAHPHPGHTAAEQTTRDDVEAPWSVQMHIHGPLSEGAGSHDSQTFCAAVNNVDVIWWTDHDWRITADRYTTSFSFDDWAEPVDHNEAWAVVSPRDDGVKAIELADAPSLATYDAGFVTMPAVKGKSFRMHAAAGAEPGRVAWRLDASRRRFTRCLAADVTCTLAVFPEVIDDGAAPFIRFELSQHAPTVVRPFGQYAIEYVLTDAPPPAPDEFTVRIPVPCEPGRWNALTLDLSADAVNAFPHIDGLDNSIFDITLGVEAEAGTACTTYFDELEFTQLNDGPELIAWQQGQLAALQTTTPEVTQHQGAEISYFEHLNVYGPTIPAIDYDAMIAESGLADESGWIDNPPALLRFSARYTVERAHEVGALVSLNHIFGAASESFPADIDPVESLSYLAGARAYGADILEVGYRRRGLELDAFLWLWDQLLLRGIPIIGNGVSDTHGGTPINWRNTPNNFVTWIFAASPEHDQLLDGLRAGRAFFGDLSRFDGLIDLETPEGWRMGGVVTTDRTEVTVAVTLDGLDAGDVIRIIEHGEVAETFVAQTPEFIADIHVEIPTTGGFVRVEVEAADGTAKAYSNPILFVPETPPEGVHHTRAGLDLLGYRATAIDDIRLLGSCADHDGPFNRLELFIDAMTESGLLVIDATEHASTPTITLDGCTGNVNVNGHIITIADIQGAGRIAFDDGVTPCPGDADCDDAVNFRDLDIILAGWGDAVVVGFNGDLNDDGLVNFNDLNQVIDNWGAICD